MKKSQIRKRGKTDECDVEPGEIRPEVLPSNFKFHINKDIKFNWRQLEEKTEPSEILQGNIE